MGAGIFAILSLGGLVAGCGGDTNDVGATSGAASDSATGDTAEHRRPELELELRAEHALRELLIARRERHGSGVTFTLSKQTRASQSLKAK